MKILRCSRSVLRILAKNDEVYTEVDQGEQVCRLHKPECYQKKILKQLSLSDARRRRSWVFVYQVRVPSSTVDSQQ